MKSTGIVRKVDELGRVVIPKELRNLLTIKNRDGLEIFTDDDTIILRKYDPLCYLCGDGSDLKYFKGKRICGKCVETIDE